MRLKQFDDWGTIYYAEADKGLSSSGTASHSRGVKLKSGTWMRVTWPDGTTERLRLAERAHTERVYDMGTSTMCSRKSSAST